MGATTRSPSFDILVESGTPPCQRTDAVWGSAGAGSRPEIRLSPRRSGGIHAPEPADLQGVRRAIFDRELRLVREVVNVIAVDVRGRSIEAIATEFARSWDPRTWRRAGS